MQGDFLMDEFLDDADFYESDDFENSGCIVNISRYNNNIDDDLDAGDAPEFETEDKWWQRKKRFCTGFCVCLHPVQSLQ